MENNTEFAISTFKVNFGCTKQCPSDVTNMLQQLKGVKSISIDPNQGKVIVVGNVNPMMIIKLLQKMGKKATLWSFDKEPNKKKTSSHAKHNHDSEDESEKQRTHHHHRSKKMHDQHNSMFGDGNQHAPPANVTGYQHGPPLPLGGYQHGLPPPPLAGYSYQPFLGYHNHHPTMSMYQPQHAAYAMHPSIFPRSMPPYGYHGQGHPMLPAYGHHDSRFSSHNPMMHYNSYADNYRPTR